MKKMDGKEIDKEDMVDKPIADNRRNQTSSSPKYKNTNTDTNDPNIKPSIHRQTGEIPIPIIPKIINPYTHPVIHYHHQFLSTKTTEFPQQRHLLPSNPHVPQGTTCCK